MKRIFTAIILFFLPVNFSFWILNLLGHQVDRRSKVGFSFILCHKLVLNKSSRIKHFNFINLKCLVLLERANIGMLNFIKGPFDIFLHDFAAIGHSNHISRAGKGISYGLAILELGTWSKITGSHHIDCTRSIKFGKYSTVAGINCQLWTHGYYHYPKGLDRFRVDGEINIGNNVYIGSMTVINPGVTIADAIIVGSNSSVSKSLLEQGMYVSQPLRYIKTEVDTVKQKLNKVDYPNLIDNVYEKQS